MNTERIREIVSRLKRSTANKEMLEVLDFAEKCLGSKPKMSEVERRERNREYVRRHREKVKAAERRSRGLAEASRIVLELRADPDADFNFDDV